MNPANIVDCLCDLVKNGLSLNSTTSVSQKEREVAQHLCATISTFNECKIFEYKDEITLDVGEMSDECESEVFNKNDYNYDSSEANDDGEPKENERISYDISEYSLEYMKEVVAYADAKDSSGKRRRSWKSVHDRYKRIPAQTYVSRFRKYIEQHGTKRQKTQNIDEIVFTKFIDARDNSLMVHDIDIQRWALKIAKEIKLDEFHASDGWLKNFKGRHGIVSRRVTNIVTKHEVANHALIEKSKEDFIKDFYVHSSHFNLSQILNTDQVGIEKEVYSKRTLSFAGEKKTFGAVASKNATTHSYTVQPTISLGGKQIGPIFLCLQEPTGKMGETVKKNLFEPSNVIITCSSSGKLTSSLVTYWRDNCLLPYIGKKCLLLSDSWSGQNDASIYDKVNCKNKHLTRIQIPQKTTNELQPLDVYYNRQMKNFIKKIYSRVNLDEIPIHMHERNNIIKIVSLVHNQLSAPVFCKMIRYSWFASGLSKTDPSPFYNVNEVCFPPITSYEECSVDDCDEAVLITCAFCSKKLCFHDFFVDYHFHGYMSKRINQERISSMLSTTTVPSEESTCTAPQQLCIDVDDTFNDYNKENILD
ncbi:unnamed protein product [Rotaria magnacalcarata]|uniref:HTH CENPB-type domain-containing protein n=1 Tax=Rotaria magnacalcarata TaxID=392030 RepID=A0A816VFE7_9BILA|nr:unnamed protein product [Rotaria magnacalcarata]